MSQKILFKYYTECILCFTNIIVINQYVRHIFIPVRFLCIRSLDFNNNDDLVVEVTQFLLNNCLCVIILYFVDILNEMKFLVELITTKMFM